MLLANDKEHLDYKTFGFYGAPWRCNYVTIPYCNFYIHGFLIDNAK